MIPCHSNAVADNVRLILIALDCHPDVHINARYFEFARVLAVLCLFNTSLNQDLEVDQLKSKLSLKDQEGAQETAADGGKKNLMRTRTFPRSTVLDGHVDGNWGEVPDMRLATGLLVP